MRRGIGPRLLAVMVILVCVLVLMLAGCGWQGKGTVVEKTHSDSYMMPRMQCITYNKGVCTGWMQAYDYVPERWGYVVKDSKGEVHHVSTTPEDWHAHKVGDLFNNVDR